MKSYADRPIVSVWHCSVQEDKYALQQRIEMRNYEKYIDFNKI